VSRENHQKHRTSQKETTVIDPTRIANELSAVARERRHRQPFTDEFPDLDLDTAYLAQQAGIDAKLVSGETLVGAKLGLTSKAKQRVMKVNNPLYGFVTSSMLAPYGEPIDLANFIHPRVEPEIAFLLARDVHAPATVTSVLDATASVFAAMDVLDSRYENFRFTLPDVVADNASAGAFILGPRAVAPAELDDLHLLGCVLRADGEVVDTAAGAAVLGHPAASVAWLANQLGARGQSLKAGWLIFSGGLTAPIPLTPGIAVTAEIAGLGAIEVHAR
jgi:2-oxo-3-hexenedioate decarboxylase